MSSAGLSARAYEAQVSQRDTSALRSVESSEWYTPGYILDAAREALGGEFDLDPASCELANTNVRAARIYTLGTPTEDREAWAGRIWLNPPSPPRPWWQGALVQGLEAVRDGRPYALAFMGYSIEVLQQSQGWGAPMMRYPLCVPRTRVRYLCTASDAHAALVKALGKRKAKSGAGPTKAEERRLGEFAAMDPRALVPGDAPTHSSCIVGLGHSLDRQRFARAFASVGEVVNGR